MSQRDYEDQPEAPDLGEVVQEPTGETLVGPPDSDVLDAGYVPPDRPYVVDDPATLARNQGLDERLRAESPDVTDDEPTGNDPDRAPRLAAAEPTPDTRYTEDLEATGVGVDGGAASAEEAAVHVRDEDETTSRLRDEHDAAPGRVGADVDEAATRLSGQAEER